MKKLLTRVGRQSPAMVVAMVALFVALSGTAVATTSALITGAQIRNNSVTGLDIKNRSIGLADLSARARGRRGARGPAGSAGAAGAKGDKGDKGDAGPKGDPGMSGYQIVTDITPTDSTSPKRLDVFCPAGKKAVGGGVSTSRPVPPEVRVTINSPDIGQTAWTGEAEESSATGANWFLHVRTICVNVAP